jgi:hypothetical protein
LSKGAPAHAQHQDLVAIGGLGLVEDQPDRLAAFGQPRQDLAGERLHDLVAAHQIVGQKPRNPLIAHVPARRRARQAGRQLNQVSAAHMQHGRDQHRQLVPLRLALPRQPLPQFRLDPFRPNDDPVPLCHRSIPRRKPHGLVASHPASTGQPIIAEN